MLDHSASASARTPSHNIPATLEQVLITRELEQRPHREPNLQNEGVSICILARMMRSAPHQLVDTVLQMALSLCNADAGGFSVLETLANGDQIFRWTHMAGTLQKFVGGSTPRSFSPCGVTLDLNAPQLFSYPAERFQYLRGAGDAPIVEALVIPVPLEDAAPATIWILTHREDVKFDAEDVRIMTDLADFTGSAVHLVETLAIEKQFRHDSQTEIAARKQNEADLTESHSRLEDVIKARTMQLRKLTARVQTVQDEERRRIARDLHDSAGQYLAGIQMNLQAFLKDAPEIDAAVTARITSASEMTDRCISEIRTISYLLHPPLLDEVGLTSALPWYVDGFAERSGIQVDLYVAKNLGRMSTEVETTLFRAVQQGLANIHRHSGSKVARIELNADAEHICLEICDEGGGIAPEVLKGFHEGTGLLGLGIAGMRERVLGNGGTFSIKSGLKGTTLRITFPLLEA